MANAKKRCRNCKSYKLTEDMININGAYFCNINGAASYAFKNKEKGKKIKNVKQKKDFQANDKSLRKEAAQKAFNAFIRARDIDLPCISCDRYHDGRYDAGHYKSVGSSPELRFNEDNCHKQCHWNCNINLSGNIENYRINLVKKIGVDKVEWLEGPHEPKKYTCEELKEIELLYKDKIKRYR